MAFVDPLGSLNLGNIVERTQETVTDFTQGVNRVVDKVDTIIDSVDDEFLSNLDFDLFEQQFRNVDIPGFPVPQFTGLVNVFDQVKGLKNTKTGLPTVEQFEQSTSKFKRLEKNLSEALTKDWKVNGSNPLILDAFALSGYNYSKDGYKGQYNWNVAFVNYILSKSNVEFFQTLGTKAYENYGTSVEYGIKFDRVRKNDLVIMQGLNNIRLIGFIQAYDPKKRTGSVIVGNVDKTVKLVKNIPFSKTNKTLFITNIRRNWQVPEAYDLPLYPVKNARSSKDAFESLTEGATTLLDQAGSLDLDLNFGQTLSKTLSNLNPLSQVSQQIDNITQSAKDSLKKKLK